MRNCFFIVLIFLVLAVPAQVLLPTPETAFEPQHNFNPQLIKAKGIRKITFEIIDKKDFEVAVDKSLTENYEFNTDGMLSRYYYTNVSKTIERQITKVNRKGNATSYSLNEYHYDTVSTSYFYQNNRLVLKRYHDGYNYYESRYYRYDSAGHLTKELRFKETNNSPNRGVFILGNQVLLSEDSFQYKTFSTGQEKCVYLNNENRPYKERITNFTEDGKKKNITENYTAASWIRQESKFVYDGARLTEAQFEGNANNQLNLKITYEYDENKELYGEKHFRNENLEKEISYVTSKADTLLNSIVIRDPVNKTIRIIRLKYDMPVVGKRE